MPEQKYQPEWEEMYDAVVISEMMGQKYFVTVTPAGTNVNLEADPYLFPQATAEELAERAMSKGIHILPVKAAESSSPEILLSFAGIAEEDIEPALLELKKVWQL